MKKASARVIELLLDQLVEPRFSVAKAALALAAFLQYARNLR
jgi:hypothetical protein